MYDAFGNGTAFQEEISNRLCYTGQQYDQATEQYYLRARYYNPILGRFMQEDEYLGDGLNLYAYCENNPVVYYDPSGYSSYEAKVGSGIGDEGGSKGSNSSNKIDYKKVFFEQNPELEGQVVVHHSVEQQVLTRPQTKGLFTYEEMHSIDNLRGIPKEINPDLHLSKIRKEWNRFYKDFQNPTKQQLLDKAAEIDTKFGHLFNPPVN
ncbi:RHS repeat-associated core domain-containing protein [Clostridium porci]|uniref:RHS repeat-associated core domain-containing protein n=1 Tax=Clostridium porci TaxID=2605778 RepID=UPI001F479E25|nr:RHS repeat-associated core domain-containing protein [Clostridium porci]